MTKEINTKTDGQPFDKDTIEKVWQKAIPEEGYSMFRKDNCGASMQKDKHGTTEIHGWEIDHIKPVSKGGTDDIDNLQPLHWENNRHKGDEYPNWTCKIKS